jgi:hypothetical protein
VVTLFTTSGSVSDLGLPSFLLAAKGSSSRRGPRDFHISGPGNGCLLVVGNPRRRPEGGHVRRFLARENAYAAIALIAAGIAILAHFASRVIVSRHLRGLSRGAAFNKFRARIKSLGSGRRGRRQAPRRTSSRRCPSLKKSQNSPGREWWELDADTEDVRARQDKPREEAMRGAKQKIAGIWRKTDQVRTGRPLKHT